MWFFFFLHHKPQLLDFAAVLRARGHDVNAGGVDAAVTQDVGQLGYVLLDPIERAGEQLPQIVREHLARRYIGLFA